MKVKGLRWVILALIALVTIINYLDRGTLNYMWVANSKVTVPQDEYFWDEANQFYVIDGDISINADLVTVNEDGSISYLNKGGIAKDLGVEESDAKSHLALITMCFMIAYGISQLFSGKLYDKIGTRKGFTLSAVLWGGADAIASISVGLKSLSFFRVLLGLGEAGPWPGTTKSNAEWFPQKERALAQGIFGAAASIGSIIAPVVIPILFLAFGWRITFLVVGSLGILWVIPWSIINKNSPEKHPWITDNEREYIISGKSAPSKTNEKGKSWSILLKEKKNYSVILGRFFLDPIWWMFVTWIPIYLIEVFDLDIKQIAMSAWFPYVGAATGSILGGWFSGMLIRKGNTVLYSRKIAILIGTFLIVPGMILASRANSATSAVVYMALILAGFQFAMTNIQTIASDIQQGSSIGSLAGLGGASAVLGTIISILFVPHITQGGDWTLFFILGALLVPACLLCVFLFLRKANTQ